MGKLRETGHWNYEPRTYAMRASIELREELTRQAMDKLTDKQLTKTYWFQRLSNAMTGLRAIDPNWEAWFDNDENVPAVSSFRHHTLLVEDRIRTVAQQNNRTVVRAVARLYRGVFIWRDKDGYFIFGEGEAKGIYEFDDEGEAQGMIDATLAMCGSLLGALA